MNATQLIRRYLENLSNVSIDELRQIIADPNTVVAKRIAAMTMFDAHRGFSK